MSSQCSMCSSHGMHKEHWFFTFSTSLLDAAKTTNFKIGKPNYRFWEKPHQAATKKVVLGQAKHPLSSFEEQALAYSPFYDNTKYFHHLLSRCKCLMVNIYMLENIYGTDEYVLF